MRIWLAPSAFYPHRGGVEELTLQLARTLCERGHDVLVVTNRHPPTLAARESLDGVQVARVAFAAPSTHPVAAVSFLASISGGVQRTLDELGPPPDLVHIQCVSTQVAHLVRYAQRRRVPLVVTTQGEVEMDAGQIFQRSAYLRHSLRSVARAAGALSACSAWAAAVTARYASPFAAAEVIPNGVDPAQWELADPPEEPVICAWGRHVPQKGFDRAIAAFGLLRERIPQARLLVGGDGPESARLAKLAGDGVEMLGALDRAGVAAMLGRSRVAVVPSRIEPFGIVAVEALAAGRGLVYAAGTGLEEAAGGLGRGVDASDIAELAAAVAAELANPTQAERARARARELSWEHVGASYLGLYERARGVARAA